LCFMGNAPSLSPSTYPNTFAYLGTGSVYSLPGTTGWLPWNPTTSNRIPLAQPWALANPTILAGEPWFGVQSNGFGFTVSWATNRSVVVEACTNLAAPVWQPLQTNVLTNPPWTIDEANIPTNAAFYFSDPQWTNYPARFYRVKSL